MEVRNQPSNLRAAASSYLPILGSDALRSELSWNLDQQMDRGRYKLPAWGHFQNHNFGERTESRTESVAVCAAGVCASGRVVGGLAGSIPVHTSHGIIRPGEAWAHGRMGSLILWTRGTGAPEPLPRRRNAG